MAIKIGGKLENVQDPKGTIANASQIATADGNSVEDKLSSLDTKIDEISLTAENVKVGEDSNVATELEKINITLEDVANKPGVRKYDDLSQAQEDLDNAILTLGDVCSVAYAPEDGSYVKDFKLYTVAEETAGVYTLKELAGASTGGDTVVGKVMLTVDEFLIDGINVLGETTYEANIGSTITFKYRFESEMYPDVRGTVYIRRGSTVIYNQKIFPNGDLNTYTYKTDTLEPGTYTFTIYGAESTGRQSERSTFRVLIGGLNVSSTFDETKTLVSGDDLKIPVVITTADPSSAITAHVSCDGNEIYTRELSAGTSTLTVPGESLLIGIHTIKVWLTNTNGKVSNELTYNITIAEEGIIYLISEDSFEAAEGARLDILLRVIQVGQEEGIFNGTLTVVNSDGEEVSKSKYSLEYGQNLISLINLKHTNTSGEYTDYTATILVEPTDENTAAAVSKSFTLRITENNYNISTLADDALECCFKAEGKTNNSVDRDQWEDLSGNGVTASFNNFNWSTNGWIIDDDGNTALTLNAGAYVELDITPFAKELAEGESMTISIDYSTKDILDSEAKVVSCLQETEGDESTIYYLRDNFGDYIEKGDSNIINYFKNIGGYCFIDGETYDADGTTEYNTTSVASNRTPNYNLGDINPAYDGKTDFRKCLGSTRSTVTKQRGFYIDTQYAVLSHSGSLSDVMQKFYLNFTEDTRTRMDFIITRNPSSDPSINPYCFQAMIGYTNGILSLMKALSSEEKFEQANIRGDKFKVYLGGKGVINENDGSIKIEQTGSAKIYSFRIYNRALTPGEILNNYAAEIPDMEKKKAVIDNNDILNTGNIAQLPQLCLIGYNKGGDPSNNTVKKFIMQLKDNGDTPISDLKAMKEPAYLTYTDPTDNSKSWTMEDENGNETNIIPIRLQFQRNFLNGLSSKEL